MRSESSNSQRRQLSRRDFCQAGGLIAAGGGALWFQQRAHAQDTWPTKAIHLVVPYAPGGSADTLGRLVGKHLSDALKQPVVVDNKAGAGGLIGSEAVARAAPDGYTLVVSGIGSHVIAPVENHTFDPMKDFTHIALLAGPPVAMVVNAQQPIKDVKGFIQYVSSQPNGISWASPGTGTHAHLFGEAFRAATKLNMVHISYKGAGAAITDVVGNQVPAAFMTLSSANAHIDSGKLRLLALTSEKRLPQYPNAPTFIELGYPKLTGITWFGISGPAGMAQAIVDRINTEVRRALKTADVQKKLALESMVTADYDAAAFTKYVAAEIERWTPMVRSIAKPKK
jgi:tripartite-type tricarboxylate transporter receptor subunit TctC